MRTISIKIGLTVFAVVLIMAGCKNKEEEKEWQSGGSTNGTYDRR